LTTLRSEPVDFSPVLGGPLYHLWLGMRAATPTLDLLVRRIAWVALVAWLPLLLLTTYERIAVGHVVPVRFLYDLDAHARFLVAIPLFLLAEVMVHRRLRPLVRRFVDGGIVRPEVLPGFQAAIDRAIRLRNSMAVELILAVAVFGLGWILWQENLSLTTSTWYAVVDPAGRRLTLAGQWYTHVSIPIFQFMSLRWLFRLLVWFFLLWQVSRLDLRLTPTHPDRAGWPGVPGRDAGRLRALDPGLRDRDLGPHRRPDPVPGCDPTGVQVRHCRLRHPPVLPRAGAPVRLRASLASAQAPRPA
jgi:hypothetical protein